VNVVTRQTRQPVQRAVRVNIRNRKLYSPYQQWHPGPGLRTDQSVCLHACQIDTTVHHSMLAVCSGLWGISPLCARGLWSSLPWTSKSPRVLLERQRRPHTPSLLALGSACPLLELPTACNGRPTASFLPGPCRRAHAPCTLAALYWPHFSLARCSASMGRMSVCL